MGVGCVLNAFGLAQSAVWVEYADFISADV